MIKRFDLNPGETVVSIIYGRNGCTTAYRNLPCGLQIQTNLRKSESFSWSNPCPPVYRVDIPPETPLGIFFKENAKIVTKWGMNWFNGFTSEYNTETTSAQTTTPTTSAQTTTPTTSAQTTTPTTSTASIDSSE